MRDFSRVVYLLQELYKEMPDGVDVGKGGIGEILLAHHLGHDVLDSDKGADGIDSEGNLYEYKVSYTDQYIFGFGSRKDDSEEVIKRHFENIKGSYCAKREGATLLEVVYIPTEIMLPYLLEHCRNTTGKTVNKNFRMQNQECNCL